MLKGRVRVVFDMRHNVGAWHIGGSGDPPPEFFLEIWWSKSDSGGFLTKKLLYAKQLRPTYSSSNYFVQTNNVHIDQGAQKHTYVYKYRKEVQTKCTSTNVGA